MEEDMKVFIVGCLNSSDFGQLYFLVFLFVGYMITRREKMMNFC
jgi:hypothetical protein